MIIENHKQAGISRGESQIINTLLKMLETEPYKNISITKICQEAGVARVTLYRNFETKENIIRHFIRILIKDYYSNLIENKSIDFKNLSTSDFEFWYKKRKLLNILSINGLENLLLEEYSRSEKYFLDLLVTNYNFDPNSKSDIEILYNQSYNFAGLWRLVFVWADCDFEETIEEMSDMLSKISTKHA